MPERAQQLYAELQSAVAVLNLIGKAEDAHLDCKEWPTKDDDAQKMLAKAACGLTNADGGVLVVGMKAESRPKDEPDVITAAAPVSDTSLVKSRILGLFSNLVEPGILGIEVTEVPETPGSKSGFVVVYVPRSEGRPRRSRKDWKFYQRIGSASLPMEYWQIEERFGQRPHPKLALHLEVGDVNERDFSTSVPFRHLVLGLRNDGLGIAKFPSIRFRRENGISVDNYGIDGNVGFGIKQRPAQPEWIIFRGGVDDVVYPGETLLITKLRQTAKETGLAGIPVTMTPFHNNQQILSRWVCNSTLFRCEISAEGMQTLNIEETLHVGEFFQRLN